MAQSTEEFIEKAKVVWGEKYDYSQTIYQGPLRKVMIVCRTHGAFEQFPYNHLVGHGCNRCGREMTRLTTAEFIKRARALFGEYDYSKVDYQVTIVPVTIVCPIHGPFRRRPADLLSKRVGCPACCRQRPRPKRGAEIKLPEWEIDLIREVLRERRPSPPTPSPKGRGGGKDPHSGSLPGEGNPHPGPLP